MLADPVLEREVGLEPVAQVPLCAAIPCGAQRHEGVGRSHLNPRSGLVAQTEGRVNPVEVGGGVAGANFFAPGEREIAGERFFDARSEAHGEVARFGRMRLGRCEAAERGAGERQQESCYAEPGAFHPSFFCISSSRCHGPNRCGRKVTSFSETGLNCRRRLRAIVLQCVLQK